MTLFYIHKTHNFFLLKRFRQLDVIYVFNLPAPLNNSLHTTSGGGGAAPVVSEAETCFKRTTWHCLQQELAHLWGRGLGAAGWGSSHRAVLQATAQRLVHGGVNDWGTDTAADGLLCTVSITLAPGLCVAPALDGAKALAGLSQSQHLAQDGFSQQNCACLLSHDQFCPSFPRSELKQLDIKHSCSLWFQANSEQVPSTAGELVAMLSVSSEDVHAHVSGLSREEFAKLFASCLSCTILDHWTRWP